ncbi:MAG: protein-(glutamine-N5) methyltransferase, release factor-specific [Candidatus Kerfeldbacteria bacterium RIFCSPHIGHO2_02_FULL_42_14]|uniref:Release factor glutamine methyltransferase n=1 Tax=Candidatus Kerfeldbacteria bacterium RIFCSPHIGHO2_02_FULL_42_14 TaxID=1798540 RepID=A0A1G2AQ25_9BACT|nr:MAG: protein-(glutamine-N5) methyltransferase, release factor-specific [Candidatus Kerfeldbacteria bacterium RIFCSPHIGHO2_02_FULL_42_14]OGY81036.1 MAG: protein-(glutamine-N5) methyltransferase, release factor-specific [Candidatus Kerfeldbacteria bacterium RIFCSPHIGHO2_12_FULL_42_13]OGY84853.1 MAG: protein-(glutamine-N5) methyltransferase, release factor-specific [Candidatus Kerfeldbacteria bacterium RIFCSPLOWO2_02_FULL_42_19]OGY85656.1 MAG: protein-(glutamine-N5) methyltransferase, release fa
MNIRDALFEAQKILTRRRCKSSTPLLDSEVLLAFVFGTSREYLYTHPEAPVAHTRLVRFRHLIQQGMKGVPIAYITESKEFFGMKFYVNPHVLIPRPDTEILVERTLKKAQKLRRPSILEIGTGSGCIAIALKKYLPHASIIATDISHRALVVARRNARRHNFPITFLYTNLFSHTALRSKKFDIIVSNPPYLSKHEASKQALAYEPRTALTPFRSTPRKFFAKLLTEVPQHLNQDGSFLFEIGNSQKSIIVRLVSTYLPRYSVKFFDDLSGSPRVACIQKSLIRT